jgi:hypothetical protein
VTVLIGMRFVFRLNRAKRFEVTKTAILRGIFSFLDLIVVKNVISCIWSIITNVLCVLDYISKVNMVKDVTFCTEERLCVFAFRM